MINLNKNDTNSYSYNYGQEINLQYVLNIFFRNKNLIISSALIFFVLFCLYSLTKKKIWQGQFEIVLEKNSSSRIQNLLGNFNNENLKLFGINNFNNKTSSIQTEVGILESPLVLMPTFNYIKSQRDSNSVKNLSILMQLLVQ